MKKKLTTSAGDRRCEFPGCKSILSIYNREIYCHLHRDLMAEKQRHKLAYHHFVVPK